MEDGSLTKGISGLWTSVNHLALVVKDVGCSLAFYTDVIGMKQVMRPNFDRHGAWLTFGNVDLHLIKGRPCVHSDDDLIVSHIAIAVSDMTELKRKLEKLNVKSRKNLSVPNPADSETGIVEQAFVRDPDGYYIEFCNCQLLESYLHKKMEEETKKFNISTTLSFLNMGKKLKKIAEDSKTSTQKFNTETTQKFYWNDLNQLSLEMKPAADPIKLENLLKRRKIYGDITQNASEEELTTLLRYFDNHVPSLVMALEERIRIKGSRKYTPPAFFERDGRLVQPPPFEIATTRAMDDSEATDRDTPPYA